MGYGIRFSSQGMLKDRGGKKKLREPLKAAMGRGSPQKVPASAAGKMFGDVPA